MKNYQEYIHVHVIIVNELLILTEEFALHVQISLFSFFSHAATCIFLKFRFVYSDQIIFSCDLEEINPVFRNNLCINCNLINYCLLS